MRTKVFVTGSSGYLGSTVIRHLLGAGYDVYGLVRDEAQVAELGRIGAHPVCGDLIRPETYRSTLRNCDAAIHAAEANDDTRATVDQLALAAFREAAEDGRLRRLVYTSGVWVLGGTGGRMANETWLLHPLELKRWRAAHEEVVMDLAHHEVSPIVFRPGILYGGGTRGIIGGLLPEAQEQGTVTVPGDGRQYWSLVHVDDVAEAYVQALGHSAADRYYLTDDSDLTAGEIGAAIAKVSGAQVRSMPVDDVLDQLGLYGQALLCSARVSSARARSVLGWTPRHPSFLQQVEDLWRDGLESQKAPVS